MKRFKDFILEQKKEVNEFNKVVRKFTDDYVKNNKLILGCLLTGSVARGDARIGPFGIYIDLAIIVKNYNDVDLEKTFGKDHEPYIPYHCISIKDKIGIAIEVIEYKDLLNIRDKDESTVFAMNESIILDDKLRLLAKWKEDTFKITEEQLKERSLTNYYRYSYFTNDYRFEKWDYRNAVIQIAQNYNEAATCYCNFLYCINGLFIPRKDWLIYLTLELDIIPDEHNDFMEILYSSSLNKKDIAEKNNTIGEIKKWMENYCIKQGWMN